MEESGYLKKYPTFGNFVNALAITVSSECKPYNILKLLNHEKDYIRAVMRG